MEALQRPVNLDGVSSVALVHHEQTSCPAGPGEEMHFSSLSSTARSIQRLQRIMYQLPYHIPAGQRSPMPNGPVWCQKSVARGLDAWLSVLCWARSSRGIRLHPDNAAG